MDLKTALKELSFLDKYTKKMQLAAEGWKNNWEILIAIILSARTRDEITIKISKKLFFNYKSPSELSKAKQEDVEKIIRPVNYYKTKSKNIIQCSKQIVHYFKGKVPENEKNLLSLHGVGRKTANVFLSEIGKFGLGVDTHVAYISQKLRWTENSNPHKIEEDLKKLFPKKYWKKVNPVLVRFGKSYSRKKQDEIINKIKRDIALSSSM